MLFGCIRSSRKPIVAIERYGDYESLSQFERLPCELVEKIMEYTPESVMEFRLTSRLLRSRVDEHAKRAGLSIVDQLTFTEEPMYSKGKLLGVIKISMSINESKSKLFELRLKLVHSEQRFNRRIMRKSTMENCMEYSVRIEKSQDVLILNYLCACIGRKVEKMSLVDCSEKKPLTAFVLNTLEEIHFQKLIFHTEKMSLDVGYFLLRIVKQHKIVHISLSIVAMSKYLGAQVNSVHLLLDLSSYVQSLHIHQRHIYGMDRAANYFLGLYDTDWAPIVLAMLSNKLDKLFIHNPNFHGYLSENSANVLRERLPLFNKKVWFKATCGKFSTGFTYMTNDHIVGANGNSMSIKHLSRVYEPDDF